MRIEVAEARLAVISDLHLGNPYSLATKKLATFIEYLIDENFSLCVNGDGVDILQGRLRGLTQQTLEVLDLLRRYTATGGRVYYVVGNHDMALERVLHTWLAEYLTPFLNVTSGRLRVRIEHGHVYDTFYAASPRIYEALGAGAAPLLRVYPDIYRLWSATTRARLRVARMMSPASDAYVPAEQQAAAMLAARGFDVIVFGHTHRAEQVDLPNGATYFNSGNWLRNSTFVEIADNRASLLQWEDSGAVPIALAGA
jgi:UDP-2,3-diacylglucosamine pyrophosphatase LpxH